jgi:hypothetical protein
MRNLRNNDRHCFLSRPLRKGATLFLKRQLLFRMSRQDSVSMQERCLTAAIVALIAGVPWPLARAQTPAAGQPSPSISNSFVPASGSPPSLVGSPQLLLDFKNTDIKFRLQSMMDILRDSRHEGWVLAAYPDPKTSRPLIGAGFGLDIEAREHPQTDPLNPRPFIEPSSAQLWQAAGLDPDLLQKILNRYDRDLEAWKKKKFRKKTRAHTLSPEITTDEATRLLRISSIQAVQNARAYCRSFDQMTASQQMALSQLVFQMGVNLEEFVQFLSTLNGAPNANDPPQFMNAVATSGAASIETSDHRVATMNDQRSATPTDHWKDVQHSLIDSQWAHKYTTRAISVIAMFDPDYLNDPRAAELRVEATLPPPAKRHRKKAHSSRKA